MANNRYWHYLPQILEYLKTHGPRSAKQIAIDVGLNEDHIRDYHLKSQARGLDILRVHHYVGRVGMLAAERRGPAPRPSSLDHVLEVLIAHRACTTADIMRETGYAQTTVSRALRLLHKKRKVHIHGYRYPVGEHGRATVLWAAGRGEDAQRTDVKVLRKVRVRRYRARMKVLKKMAKNRKGLDACTDSRL
jgi:hypothetical protein